MAPEQWRRLGEALDGVQIAMALFDLEDRCQAWNRTFLQLFPEHAGQVHVGEPYRDNLRRFYQRRLTQAELQHIERHIDSGVARHRVQHEPFVFEHHGRTIQASSQALGPEGRLRLWRTDPGALRSEAPEPLNLKDQGDGAPPSGALLLDRVPEGLMVCDRDGVIQWVNEPFVRLYGLPSRRVALGTPFEAVLRGAWSRVPPGQRHQLHDGLATLRDQLNYAGAPFELSLPEERVVRVIARPAEDGAVFYAHVDISELKRQQRRLAEAERAARASEAALRHKSVLLEATLENMDQGVAMIGADGIVELYNRRVLALLGLQPADLGPRPHVQQVIDLLESRGEYQAGSPARELMLLAQSGPGRRTIYQRRRPTGQVLEVQSAPLPDGGALRTFTDVTERIAAEERVRHAASHDGLTGLMNRNTFLDCLGAEVALARRSGEGCAVLYLDLDGFKAINDQHGHAIGDEALVWAAGQLRQVARESDFVARLGGDEFVLLQRGVHSRPQVQALIERLEQALGQPFECQGRALRLGVSIGAAFCPDDAEAAGPLLQRADHAMYEVKAARAAARG